MRSAELRATWLEHDPKELALDVVGDRYRFSLATKRGTRLRGDRAQSKTWSAIASPSNPVAL
jgi:hypothetical protein